MPKFKFEPLVISTSRQQGKDPRSNHAQRPPWVWILREQIEPLCAEYGLIIEYGSENDESCAIFYGDGWWSE